MQMGQDSRTIEYLPFNLIATVRTSASASGEKLCCLFVSGTTIRDLGHSCRNVCIEGDEGGERVKLSGFEVIGVRMLHHDYCKADVGHSFVTNWEFNRVINQAQNICQTRSSDKNSSVTSGGNSESRSKGECSLHVCVKGTGFAMLLLRVVDDRDLREFVGKLEVGKVRAEVLNLGGEEQGRPAKKRKIV